MPKTTKGKTKRKMQPYNKLDVKNALDAVARGESVRSASNKFNVPYSTLRSKHAGIYPVDKKSGPPTILTNEEEKELKIWMLNMSKKGFPLTKYMLLNSVKMLVKELKRPTPFKDGIPGRRWLEGFMSRHSELSVRVSQNLCQRRGTVTEISMRNWYKEVGLYLRSKNMLDIDGSRIFNCDESAFLLNPQGHKVFVKKNSKSVHSLVGSNDKECLTVLITGNATGQLAPPKLMFAYQRITTAILNNIESGWAVGKSDNGWMTAESFYEYIVNIFYPWCVSNNIQFPIILYVDGHSSHATLPLSNFCKEHEIELISLHANATHVQQPLDVSFFRPLKESWKNSVSNWRMNNGGAALQKSDFSPVLKTALHSLDLIRILKRGFQCCGLSPFSAYALDYSKLLMSSDSEENIGINSQILRPLDDPKNSETTKRCIEDFLPPSTLQLFQTADQRGDGWHGAKEFQKLFTLWQKCQQSTTERNNEAAEEVLVVK